MRPFMLMLLLSSSAFSRSLDIRQSHTGNTITDPFLLQSGLNSPTKPRPLPGNSLEQLLSRLGADQSEIELATASLRQTQNVSDNINNDRIGTRSDAFWMETIQHGQMPFAPADYKFFRNVKDYGAIGDGQADDTAAINQAMASGNRCGFGCNSTSVLGALIYFPPGIYKISAPIIQPYYTQMVGDPSNRPVIQGSSTFTGIALIDADPYIPGANGNEWFINQNQFYRQVRNFILDMTVMPDIQIDPVTHWATFNATGIHWQVAQATSLQYIDFNMPVSPTTHAIGLYMENGSGGFVSELRFTGGHIGFRAGSQQFTARGLHFIQSHIAISMVWDWGFTWKSIIVENCYVAIQCVDFGGADGQGVGSISVIDSSFTNVPYAIPIPAVGWSPSIVLDNLQLNNVPAVVLYDGGLSLLKSSGQETIQSWTMGKVFTSAGEPTFAASTTLTPPIKDQSLLDEHNNFVERARPHYGSDPPTKIANSATGISNDGTGDQSEAINRLLADSVGSVVFFPAGVYLVRNTVFVPVGSRIVGEGWSQIMGTGSAFSDASRPKPVIKVGNAGDSGVLELSDLLFTVKGPNPGAILVEWNIHESTHGSAGMWDCHFRVGGAAGSDLQRKQCPHTQGNQPQDSCKAAALLLHVTSKASGYFENVWGWVADHDLDADQDTRYEDGQISVYSGRGFLIESQGPSWWYGTASEHSQLYQYQLLNAKNAFLGHMQSETPYYQAAPTADKPFTIGRFPSDPTFRQCISPFCKSAWALRVIRSSNIYIYSAGFYSFFQNYNQDCAKKENCQQNLVQTEYTGSFWLFNLFTKGSLNAVTAGGGFAASSANLVQAGFTTETAAWLVLSGDTASKGNDADSSSSAPVCRPARDSSLLARRDEL